MLNKIQISNRRFWAGIKTGANLLQKIKAALGLVFISRLHNFSFSMKIGDNVWPVLFRTGSDVAMWLEIFIDDIYKLPANFQPQKIIDLGANVGFSALYFSLLYPRAQIIALEPDPQNQMVLQENLNGRSNISINTSAISNVGGKRDLFTLPRQGMSSSFFHHITGERIRVQSISFSELLYSLNWQHVDLVKFDIEGAEWETFKVAPLNRIKTLIGEYHEDIVGRSLEDFLKLFRGFDSKVRQLYSGRYLVLLRQKGQ